MKMRFWYIIFIMNLFSIDFEDLLNNKENIMQLTLNTKELFSKNELQVDIENLNIDKNKRLSEYKATNNQTTKITFLIQDFTNELFNLMVEYKDEEINLIKIIQVINNLEKEISDLGYIEEIFNQEDFFFDYLIKNKNNNNIFYFVFLNIILTLEQLLIYKEELYKNKKLNIEKIITKLGSTYNFLNFLIQSNQTKTMITK